MIILFLLFFSFKLRQIKKFQMEAVAIFDYFARNKNEASLKAGQILKVI
jgi:hypothetical protein